MAALSANAMLNRVKNSWRWLTALGVRLCDSLWFILTCHRAWKAKSLKKWCLTMFPLRLRTPKLSFRTESIALEEKERKEKKKCVLWGLHMWGWCCRGDWPWLHPTICEYAVQIAECNWSVVSSNCWLIHVYYFTLDCLSVVCIDVWLTRNLRSYAAASWPALTGRIFPDWSFGKWCLSELPTPSPTEIGVGKLVSGRFLVSVESDQEHISLTRCWF